MLGLSQKQGKKKTNNEPKNKIKWEREKEGQRDRERERDEDIIFKNFWMFRDKILQVPSTLYASVSSL